MYYIDMQYYSTQGKFHPEVSNDGSNCEAAEIWWTLWPASLMFKPWLSTWSTTAAQISLEMTILLFLSPPPLPSSHPLPPPCPPPPCPPTPPRSCPRRAWPAGPPRTCPRPVCPPLPPPLPHTPLLLWLLISSKFSIVYQTKQRLKALLCCSPHCKLLNRPECLEI